MRIIFLNSWRGQIWDKYKAFITQHTNDTDIFCLMEMYPGVHHQVSSLLPNFIGYYVDGGIYHEDNLQYGQSTFFKNTITVVSEEKKAISNRWVGQIIKYSLKIENKDITLLNVHGVSRPGNKLDTDIRIEQSKKILNMAKGTTPIIIGGDFNLFPETQSIKMFENSGYKNLIKDFNITNTRNKLSWDQFPDEVAKFSKQYFADYCFISPEVKVKSFTVPNVEVSDHEPQILDFEI